MNRKVVVIGGGFYGCSIALMLKRRGYDPVVVEAADALLTRASRVNQARVHGGYHYPRSLMTAYRSRFNYDRFRKTYPEAIADKFTKIYAVGRSFSKVTAPQFSLFMKRIGAPLKTAPKAIRAEFNPVLTEDVWIAEECAFDYSILRDGLEKQLSDEKISVLLSTRAEHAEKAGDDVVVRLSGGQEVACGLVINATYSGLNLFTKGAGLPIIPLKHELTEMALVELPAPLKDISVTMMCGPFFSFMPYPARGLTTLSHVRYTPHLQWFEKNHEETVDPYSRFTALKKETNFRFMVGDAARYMPALADAVYKDSLWEVKTLLPLSEVDDGRPILFRRDPMMPQVVHVMGGKIDNIFDVEDGLDEVLGTGVL